VLAGDRGLARTTRALIVLVLGVGVLLALAPARAHAIGVSSLSLTSVDPAAGAHSDFTLNVALASCG
jgi:hypothetical protein